MLMTSEDIRESVNLWTLARLEKTLIFFCPGHPWIRELVLMWRCWWQVKTSVNPWTCGQWLGWIFLICQRQAWSVNPWTCVGDVMVPAKQVSYAWVGNPQVPASIHRRDGQRIKDSGLEEVVQLGPSSPPPRRGVPLYDLLAKCTIHYIGSPPKWGLYVLFYSTGETKYWCRTSCNGLNIN